ncbi:MAG TPA: hydrolase [Spongiibacteraceae bacterium]|nr:hydrolase [Spongiibacteraceae bacterium]MBN51633.1 hydrolase [Spongiibacteraceae bacterium]HCS28573.1 hydrolase [Spongiibacteraceae bacterium]
MTDQRQRLFAHYQLGETTIFSAPDNRFSYCLYVPRQLEQENLAGTRLLVAIHGTGRMQTQYRELFAEFAEYHNCIVVAPLFPANVLGDGNLSGYKYLLEGDIRYDQVLLEITRTVAATYGVSDKKMMLFGFSGGAHFVHRFLMLHPHRVSAASIGAPGVVTLLDPAKEWWLGIADTEQHFDIQVDPNAVSGMPIHLAVGGADTETWEITVEADDAYYMPGINDSGDTRLERLQSLKASLEHYGAKVRLDIVEGETHNVAPIAQFSKAFFRDVILGRYS